MGADEAATAYFAVHSERDHGHAAQSRRLLRDRAGEGDADRLVGRARGCPAGNWRLLDGVDAHPG